MSTIDENSKIIDETLSLICGLGDMFHFFNDKGSYKIIVKAENNLNKLKENLVTPF